MLLAKNVMAHGTDNYCALKLDITLPQCIEIIKAPIFYNYTNIHNKGRIGGMVEF